MLLTRKSTKTATSQSRLTRSASAFIGNTIDRRTFLKRSGLATGGAALATPYGDYAVLVVARRGAKDWLIGCQLQQVAARAATPPLPVTLTPFDNTVQIMPADGCQSLTQYCQGQCPRP